MTDKNEKKPGEEAVLELHDLAQEASEEQLKDVLGGDLMTSSRPIVKKVVIRP
ncbi:hypothetical protein [Cohnella sp. 56]|uniref:hypothetical protein n=1 Tax=Cohnella sp. 56 TaxID=3113722 RepID=UPI0030E7EC44